MDKTLASNEDPRVFELTDEQRKIVKEKYLCIRQEAFQLEKALIKAGLEPDQALSVSHRLHMDLAATSAILSAVLDGREPRQDWFEKNASFAWSCMNTLMFGPTEPEGDKASGEDQS